MSNFEEINKQIFLVKAEIYKLQCMGIDMNADSFELNNAYDRVCDFEEEINKLKK